MPKTIAPTAMTQKMTSSSPTPSQSRAFQRVEEAAVPLDHCDRHENQAKLGRHDPAEQRPGAPALLRAEIRQSQREERPKDGDDSTHDAYARNQLPH